LRRWFEADGEVLLPRRGRRRRRARLIGDHPRRYALVGLVTFLLPSEHGNDDREHEDDRPCHLGDLRSAHRWGAGGEDLGGREGAGFVLHGDGEEAAGVHGVLREDGGVALNLRGVALLVTCGDAVVAHGLLGIVGGGDLNSDIYDTLVEFRTDDVPVDLVFAVL